MENSASSNKLQDLLRSGRKYYFSKGQSVGSSDNRLIISMVASGFIRRYLITKDGSSSVQSIYGPNDIYPLTLILKLLFDQDITSSPVVYQYQAMTKTEIYILDNETFIKNVESDPILYRDLLIEAGKRLKSNIQKLDNLSLDSSYKRVAQQLSYYAKKFGETTPQGTKIILPLTHLDLANILNITRETVTINLKQLRDKGLIQTNGGLIVPNINKLAAAAHS